MESLGTPLSFSAVRFDRLALNPLEHDLNTVDVKCQFYMVKVSTFHFKVKLTFASLGCDWEKAEENKWIPLHALSLTSLFCGSESSEMATYWTAHRPIRPLLPSFKSPESARETSMV